MPARTEVLGDRTRGGKEPLVIAVTRQYTMATSLTDTGGRRMRE